MLQQASFDQLDGIRSSRAGQIEAYFRTILSQVKTLTEDDMIVAAMVRFNQGFNKLNNVLIPEEWNTEIRTYYREEFIPRLSKNMGGEPMFPVYSPRRQTARYLQYHYIVNNTNPVGEKDNLTAAQDGSEYSKVHARYHQRLRHLIKEFGYYDLFLINFRTGDIVYSVYKETDFGTNLSDGAYRKSNLAHLVSEIQAHPDRWLIHRVDFSPYDPSYGEPAAFLGGAIYNGPHIVGILAFQLPVDRINSVMTGDGNWENDGLGTTGETYIVGPDFFMRSVSRLLLQQPDNYAKYLQETKTPYSTIQKIKAFKTSILLQSVDTVAARRAILGRTGTGLMLGHRNTPVLSSYAPLRIPGFDWGIVAEREVSEVYKPIQSLQKAFWIVGIVLMVGVTFLATVFAGRFMEPVVSLIQNAKQVEAGHYDIVMPERSADEFGQLAQSFNGIVDRLRQEAETVEKKAYENRQLLENVLPQDSAQRLQQHEGQMADRVRHVTVLYASVVGFTEFSEQRDAIEATHLLSELWDVFNAAAEQHGVEPQQTMGPHYLAVCGLAGLYLDHAKRTLDFSRDLFKILQAFNDQHAGDLRLQIGVDSGQVTAGIVGLKRFKYDVWGPAVDLACDLHHAAEPSAILVSPHVYEQVRELYTFVPGSKLERRHQAPLETWHFRLT